MKFILGKKIEMTQMFDEERKVIPVTLVEAGPCFVTQIKDGEKDKYQSMQIGFEDLKKKRIKKSNAKKPYKKIKEFRGNDSNNIDISKYKVNDKIDVSIFEENDIVNVSGISKGKGFQGIVKRWGFGGKPHTHGTKHEARSMGSAGPAYPQHVIKGRKMPGRMGNERTTVKNLKIVKVDKENNVLAIKGAIPGRRGTLLEIKSQK